MKVLKLPTLFICVVGVTFFSACSKQQSKVSQRGGTASANEFVKVAGSAFFLRGEPYRFVGTNVWYAAYLGSTSEDCGDRARLIKELNSVFAADGSTLEILQEHARALEAMGE
jgi:mannan endo-1,4-beta-mannosidase